MHSIVFVYFSFFLQIDTWYNINLSMFQRRFVFISTIYGLDSLSQAPKKEKNGRLDLEL